MRVFHRGFNFSQDGPGNRLVYHLQGCNFACPWCSNPEGMSLSGECEICSIQDLLSQAVRAKPLFFDGGGVTFTGGECTVQHDELLELLKLLKKNGIHTALETNASDPQLSQLLDYTDYLMADLKHTDSDLHKKFTSAANTMTLENIGLVIDSGRQILVRIPLINGFNLDAQAFISFFSSHDTTNVEIEVLRYHEYGKSKWKSEYKMRDGFVSDQDYNCFVSTLKKARLNVVST